MLARDSNTKVQIESPFNSLTSFYFLNLYYTMFFLIPKDLIFIIFFILDIPHSLFAVGSLFFFFL